MYNIKRNNYYENEKNYTIYTPDEISNFIYRILVKEFDKDALIFDPCVGAGSLVKPWLNGGYNAVYFDINFQGFENTKIIDYLSLKKEDINFKPNLILINPPFNSDEKLREATKKMGLGVRPFIPEAFLKKSIELFGNNVPIVLFTPYGFRLNVNRNSKRLKKFINGEYPEITSIISLPKNIYDDVTFHSEILIFNTKNTKPHYFAILDKEV